jgi:hypothetical protein
MRVIVDRGRRGVVLALALAPVLAWTAASAQPAAPAPEAPLRFRAPIAIEQAGAFVRLPLPASAYAMCRQADLADLRVVDANGARVPFALLGPRAPQRREAEVLRPVDLYPLPAPRPGQKELASPIEMQVVGDRISVRRLGGPGAAGAAALGATERVTPGWLFDLGDSPEQRARSPEEPGPRALRLEWAGPAEFTAAYEIETSKDLRQWRRAGGGQLLAVASAAAQLAQREVRLPAGEPSLRFVRLRWADPAQAPRLSGAQLVRVASSAIVLDAPVALSVLPVPEPAVAPAGAAREATLPPGALHYDLGALLPIVDLDLLLPAGHRLAAVRVQGRARPQDPWQELAQTVFYRIERGESIDRPPALPLATRVRYLRLVPDTRAGTLPAAALELRAQLQSVLFAPQGTGPFSLLAGSADATPGALPVATLVPALELERPRFGRATLGAWSEDAAVARSEARRESWAAWRPALLWAVLLAGVGALAWVVWRLASGPAPGPAGTPPAASQAEADRST